MAALDTQFVLDQFLAAPHFRVGLGLCRMSEICVVVSVSTDLNQSGGDGIPKIGPRQGLGCSVPVCRNGSGGQIKKDRNFAVDGDRHDVLAKITETVVDGDGYSAVGQAFVEGRHALVLREMVDLALESPSGDVYLAIAPPDLVIKEDNRILPLSSNAEPEW
jgi:hypothetical protein